MLGAGRPESGPREEPRDKMDEGKPVLHAPDGTINREESEFGRADNRHPRPCQSSGVGAVLGRRRLVAGRRS